MALFFNLGEKVNACTSALYPLLVALVNFLANLFTDFGIPETGYMIGVIALALTVLACSNNFIKKELQIAAYFFPLILLCYPRLRARSGHGIFSLDASNCSDNLFIYQKELFFNGTNISLGSSS